jgi:hypothetical protein
MQSHSRLFFFLFIFAVAACFGPAVAGERVDLMFTNNLDQEIVSIRVRYSTPYGEPRHSSSQVFLESGENYRVGVHGTILPERILVELATRTYDFSDLSGIEPENNMHLEVAHEEGRPVLRRLNSGETAIQGVEYDYLTAANRPNAVDRDYLTAVNSWEEVTELVTDAVATNQEELGGTKTFDIEAGPIWNNDHARERCPQAVEEWNGENGANARWTGQWVTTAPGEMSVCGCVSGVAGLAETFFEEDAGWGKTLSFPVFWKEWYGAARVMALDKNNPDEGVGIDLRFRLPENETDEMLDELLSDLRVDGFRPWRFTMRVSGGGASEGDELELAFVEGEGDKYDDQDEMQRLLFGAYGATFLAEATAVWVKEDTFETAREGGEPPAAPGVLVMFSQGTFKAVFVPDGRMFMR